jgi:hypothetical protein
MPSERRFRDDGTKSTRFHKPNDGDDRMNEKKEDVVHAGILSNSQKLPEFRPILEFATDRHQSGFNLPKPPEFVLPWVRQTACRASPNNHPQLGRNPDRKDPQNVTISRRQRS